MSHDFSKVYIDRGKTGSKYSTGVNNAGGYFLTMSTTPVVNNKIAWTLNRTSG
jgi:hypothetical protein